MGVSSGAMTRRLLRSSLLTIGLAVAVSAGCGESTPKAARDIPAHCDMESAPSTAFAGGQVTPQAVLAGAAEGLLNMPIGSALGAYTSRARGFGGDGFYDDRDYELSEPFSASVGLETAPRVKALAIGNGEDHVVILKLDIGASYRGLTRDVEKALGDEFSGKVILATSHTHAGFGHFTGSQAFYLGFSIFRREVYDAVLADSVAVAREAIENMVPAAIGVAYDGSFDLDDRVNRDRREVNDELAGGKLDDHHLFVMRVDTAAGDPIALVPVVGLHGTVAGARNMWASVEAPGYIERVLEEAFDENVLVMHLQGAAGDVSPAGSHGVSCSGELCANYARMESVGQHAKDAILALYAEAGAEMRGTLEIEMLTRDVGLGPEIENLEVRDGELRYASFDGVSIPDYEVYDEEGNILSPIDEFNAPAGAALCFEGVPLQSLLMPGGIDLASTPYGACNRVDRLAGFIGPLFGFDLGETPVCDSIHTTVSALRLGEHVFATLPGEPTTLLVEALRESSPAGVDKTIVIGYAQDHIGYLLRPEDWLLGGYEPSITFWGPLEGEAIMERALELLPLVLSETREDAARDGVPFTRPQDGPDDLPAIDPSPLAGTVPETVPEGILVPNGVALAGAQPAEVIERFQTAHFVFIGDDPRKATPRVTLEHQGDDGVFRPVSRRSGRAVMDGEIHLTWTPMPLIRDGGQRDHHYVVSWQAVPALGQVETLEERAGLEVGSYRFRVELADGPPLHSGEMLVTEATLEVQTADAGGDLQITARYDVPEDGFRLLRLDGPSKGLVPVRGDLTVRFLTGGGDLIEEVVAPAAVDGSVTVTPPGGVGSIVVLDDYGNEGAAVP
jgi:neutral ceramidase